MGDFVVIIQNYINFQNTSRSLNRSQFDSNFKHFYAYFIALHFRASVMERKKNLNFKFSYNFLIFLPCEKGLFCSKTKIHELLQQENYVQIMKK